MKFAIRRSGLLAAAGILAVAAAVCAARASKPDREDDGIYVQTNLVSDIPGMAEFTDPDLVNPWGISFGPKTPFWVSDNGTGKTTLYNGAGVKQGLIVTIPPPMGSPAGTVSAPTGQVFNGSTGFAVTANGKTGAARFIFATEDGTISGWNPAVDPTHAVLAVDRSDIGAVYKGLAIANTSNGWRLYATDFRNRQVDIFGPSFNLIGHWTDHRMPTRFSPFNVQTINGMLVVTFAKQDQAAHDDVPGPGNGIIDIVDPNTGATMRFATGHGDGGEARVLNSPWGVALAPATFGRFGGDLLVGNFGNGRINAFDPATGEFLGQLQSADDRALVIDGLWALTFGNGAAAGDPHTLYFTAGLDDEQHGLFGNLVPAVQK